MAGFTGQNLVILERKNKGIWGAVRVTSELNPWRWRGWRWNRGTDGSGEFRRRRGGREREERRVEKGVPEQELWLGAEGGAVCRAATRAGTPERGRTTPPPRFSSFFFPFLRMGWALEFFFSEKTWALEFAGQSRDWAKASETSKTATISF